MSQPVESNAKLGKRAMKRRKRNGSRKKEAVDAIPQIKILNHRRHTEDEEKRSTYAFSGE